MFVDKQLAPDIPTWIDDFLFWDAVVVACLMFLDFLIGKEGRAKIKETVGWWWLLVSENSFAGLLARDARMILNILRGFFGVHTFSTHFLKRTAQATLVVFVPLSLLVTALILIEHPILSVPVGYDLFQFPATIEQKLIQSGMPIIVLVFYLWGVVGNCVSVAVTMRLLLFMMKKVSFVRLASVMVLDLVLAYVVFFITLLPSGMLLDWIAREWELFHRNAFKMQFGSQMLAVSITTALPSFLHLALAVAFLNSKLVGPVLRAPTALIFQRLYESEKGVLTLVAIALGVVAKLTQEGIKYFGS